LKIFKILTVLYLFGIVVVSLVSFNNLPKIQILSQDKPIHFLMYFGFSFLLSLAYNLKTFSWKRLLYILSISFTFGFLMEVCQELLTNYRHFDLKDIYANALGSTTGIVIAYFFKKKLKNVFF
jgi:VanZ family protein